MQEKLRIAAMCSPVEQPLSLEMMLFSEKARFAASVQIIRYTHIWKNEPRLHEWSWYLRSTIPCHEMTWLINGMSYHVDELHRTELWVGVLDPLLQEVEFVLNDRPWDERWEWLKDAWERAHNIRKELSSMDQVSTAVFDPSVEGMIREDLRNMNELDSKSAYEEGSGGGLNNLQKSLEEVTQTIRGFIELSTAHQKTASA